MFNKISDLKRLLINLGFVCYADLYGLELYIFKNSELEPLLAFVWNEWYKAVEDVDRWSFSYLGSKFERSDFFEVAELLPYNIRVELLANLDLIF